MKKIPLTRGKFALVDNEDYDRLMAMGKWHCANNGYAAKRKGKIFFMHRFLIDAPDTMRVDHINRNPLDNRKSNLRLCTQSQNIKNQKIRKDNTTSFKGVCYAKYCSKFRARITFDGKHVNIGYFNTAIEAAKAYNIAAVKYHEEFANLNEIPA